MPAETNHPIFQQPPNPNTKIWRYMDFAKYVSLLDPNGLWFSRMDKLGESLGDKLGDPFEGTLSRATIEYMREGLKRVRLEDEDPDELPTDSPRNAFNAN
jgi:hypothetical protein